MRGDDITMSSDLFARSELTGSGRQCCPIRGDESGGVPESNVGSDAK